jgi:hypothetical protein
VSDDRSKKGDASVFNQHFDVRQRPQQDSAAS